MTKKRDLKALARARAAKLGTSYTTALAAIRAESDTEARPKGCLCHLEAGDSPCPVHDERFPRPDGAPHCETPHGECVLPKGHLSDEHGDDHQAADGTWWNVGTVAPRALEEVTAKLTALEAELKASGVSEGELVALRGFGNPVPKQFAEWAELARLKVRLERDAELRASKCDRCGTPMADGGSVGFYCPKKDCLPPKPKLNATELMRKAFNAWGIAVGEGGKLTGPDGRTLKARWDPESSEATARDLKVFHGIDGEVELARAMMDTVFASLFGKDPETPKPPEVLWKGKGAQAVFAADEFERGLIASAKALAKGAGPSPVDGPTPSDLWQRQEVSAEEKARLAALEAQGPACTCGSDLGASFTCAFHHPPIVEAPATAPESIDVGRKLMDRLVTARVGVGEQNVVTVDTGDLGPEEATRILTAMKTRFNGSMSAAYWDRVQEVRGTGPYAKPPWGKLGLCVVCGKNVTCECKAAPEGTTYARCTNPKCAKVYSMRPTESRRCEHCGHTPVEVIDPDAEVEPRGGFLTAKCICGPTYVNVFCPKHVAHIAAAQLDPERCPANMAGTTPSRCELPKGHSGFHRRHDALAKEWKWKDNLDEVLPDSASEAPLRGRTEHAVHIDDANLFTPDLANLPPIPVKDLVPVLEALKYINSGDAHADEAREEASEALEAFDQKHHAVLTALHDPTGDDDYDPQEPIECFVNGRPVELPRETSYREVVQAAGYDGERVLSVTYRKGNSGGILHVGEPIFVERKMTFSVADTSNA